jgi:cation diffusion facilitator CzcD-associated flavoprotein CzcO
MTAAQLKAYGVECVVLDRNAKIGDNWASRYDSLRFHVPTSNCEMPYMSILKPNHPEVALV